MRGGTAQDRQVGSVGHVDQASQMGQASRVGTLRVSAASVPGTPAGARAPDITGPAGAERGSGHALHQPLLGWYAAYSRDLPWREPGCPAWHVLISEIMLQQTPVARVLPVWTQWVERWPEPADLAAAPSGEAIRAWDRLGYPRRALRLHQAATTIVAEHGGQVPRDHAQLLALPGVGGYTAAAVASFAFRQRHAVVDTNVRRVFARVCSGAAQAAPALTAAEQRLAQSLLPDDAERASRWNIAVMELGALVCTARSPHCQDCPVTAHCAWLQAGQPAHTGPVRKGQPWAGTDRQIRGAILAALRSSQHPLRHAQLIEQVPDSALRDSFQRERCLDSLVSDGLVEPGPGNTYRLPG